MSVPRYGERTRTGYRASKRPILWPIYGHDPLPIVTAWCACKAGTFVCNHIVAVLYKVEHVNIMGHNDPLCTYMPCQWNHSQVSHVSGCSDAEWKMSWLKKSEVRIGFLASKTLLAPNCRSRYRFFEILWGFVFIFENGCLPHNPRWRN